MRILGIIPARYASTRFPGKPLADLNGFSMIQRVYQQCKKCTSLNQLVVATDDGRIAEHVQTFGEVVMTNPNHPSGTDRCRETVAILNKSFDYVINIQGDEPFIDPAQINLLISLLEGNTELATLGKVISAEDQLHDPNTVKVVLDSNYKALYFSRNPIPFQRSAGNKPWTDLHKYLKHIGIYAYRTDILQKITQLPVSALERAESLEQLRWLEHGFQIKVGITDLETFGIDTPEDLERAKKWIERR